MINIYIPQNQSIFYTDLIIFSLLISLLIDKTISYIFPSSNNSTK